MDGHHQTNSSAGSTPTASATNAPKAMPPRRRKQANPLVQPKKRTGLARPQAPTSRPQPSMAVNLLHANAPNGVSSTPVSRSGSGQSQASTEPKGPYKDYPIFTTKRQLIEGMRHHVMRFLPYTSAGVNEVNPRDEHQFMRPVRLHRRDPRANPAGRSLEDEDEEMEEPAANPQDSKERERLEIAKAERRAEREANQALIAPVGPKPEPKKQRTKARKQTEQVFQMNDSARKKKEMSLRYEEALPWHIEDFDNKNSWRGTYESALSECHVALMAEKTEAGETILRMVPVEKWYKFTPKSQKIVLSLEQAEAEMKSRAKQPRWLLVQQQRETEVKRQAKAKERQQFVVKRERQADNLDTSVDVDDVDFDEREEFADDEDAAIFEGQDEDVSKDAEERIKREQREANVFELKEEKDFDKEEEEEKRKAAEERKLQKKLQKALMERERNFDYEDDSEGNPYMSESSSSDSEIERGDAVAQQQPGSTEGAAAVGATTTSTKDGKAVAGTTTAPIRSKHPSSTPSRTSTPVPGGRPTGPESLRQKVLKRPGSPNLSDASGSESTRKKQKKKHLDAIAGTNGAPNSRPMSPAFGGRGAASGSEGELSETSRRLNRKRRGEASNSATVTSKLQNISPSGSPGGSRAASPAPAGSNTTSPNKNQGTSATNSGNATPVGAGGSAQGSASQQPPPKKSKPPPGPLPTSDEIRKFIPGEGILLKDLITKFKASSNNPGFIPLVRSNARFVKETNMLFPKNP